MVKSDTKLFEKQGVILLVLRTEAVPGAHLTGVLPVDIEPVQFVVINKLHLARLNQIVLRKHISDYHDLGSLRHHVTGQSKAAGEN
jgi:hypothetical protein